MAKTFTYKGKTYEVADWRTRTKGTPKQKGKKYKVTPKSGKMKGARKTRNYKPKKDKYAEPYHEAVKDIHGVYPEDFPSYYGTTFETFQKGWRRDESQEGGDVLLWLENADFPNRKPNVISVVDPHISSMQWGDEYRIRVIDEKGKFEIPVVMAKDKITPEKVLRAVQNQLQYRELRDSSKPLIKQSEKKDSSKEIESSKEVKKVYKEIEKIQETFPIYTTRDGKTKIGKSSENQFVIGTLYKVKDPEQEGRWIYVEIEPTPSYAHLKDDEVYSGTRTPYSTSMFGQIESAGIIKKEKLVPLDKSDKKEVEQIERVKKIGEERSKLAYDIAKSTQKQREANEEALKRGERKRGDFLTDIEKKREEELKDREKRRNEALKNLEKTPEGRLKIQKEKEFDVANKKYFEQLLKKKPKPNEKTNKGRATVYYEIGGQKKNLDIDIEGYTDTQVQMKANRVIFSEHRDDNGVVRDPYKILRIVKKRDKYVP